MALTPEDRKRGYGYIAAMAWDGMGDEMLQEALDEYEMGGNTDTGEELTEWAYYAAKGILQPEEADLGFKLSDLDLTTDLDDGSITLGDKVICGCYFGDESDENAVEGFWASVENMVEALRGHLKRLPWPAMDDETVALTLARIIRDALNERGDVTADLETLGEAKPVALDLMLSDKTGVVCVSIPLKQLIPCGR